ncbi:MAG TPA: ArsR family transcriptional regulator, partial [Sporomusaceae bacterium]|nr:ArsR family transcriptional regulator [Sporomusaceae bacterium]
LDEIGEMEFVTQGKLLRVLQEKKVMRLGNDSVIPVDVRIIAASNKSLKTLVSENKFRSDLYYRLNVLQLRLPPLRSRKADIKPLG